MRASRAIKDLTDVAGVRTTYGSPIFKDHVPQQSDIWSNLERAGGIVYAKTNTPEFGAGANTFNEVFGPTLNPWNTSLSAAGSSGGSAVALATGMAWLAQGSDMGGSLRNPASFCGVVGLRPSPGRVAASPGWRIDETLSVEGPMARNVADMALFLDAMTGADRAIPCRCRHRSKASPANCEPRPTETCRLQPRSRHHPGRPASCPMISSAARRFQESALTVEETHPDFSEAHECFHVLRAFSFATSRRDPFAKPRDQLKPEVIRNIEKGLKLTGPDIARAYRQRFEMFHRAALFFASYDLILSPATIVAPYPSEQRYVDSCEPALSSPTTSSGWPSPTRLPRYAARRSRCPAASPTTVYRSGSRSPRRRVAKPPF